MLRIIEKFGGSLAMSRQLTEATKRRVPYTTVRYWDETSRIPSHRQQEVLDAAKALGIEATHADFFEHSASEAV